MKPRLPVRSLTLQDLAIIFGVALRFAPHHDRWIQAFCRVSVPQDRRDADLMLEAQCDKTASIVLFREYDRRTQSDSHGVAIDVRGIGDGWCPL
jgi:hypothetical protein